MLNVVDGLRNPNQSLENPSHPTINVDCFMLKNYSQLTIVFIIFALVINDLMVGEDMVAIREEERNKEDKII